MIFNINQNEEIYDQNKVIPQFMNDINMVSFHNEIVAAANMVLQDLILTKTA